MGAAAQRRCCCQCLLGLRRRDTFGCRWLVGTTPAGYSAALLQGDPVVALGGNVPVSQRYKATHQVSLPSRCWRSLRMPPWLRLLLLPLPRRLPACVDGECTRSAACSYGRAGLVSLTSD